MDKTTICNQALILLGEYEYVENSGTQHPCDLWYNTVVNACNARYNWAFTRRRKILTSTHRVGEDFVYPLPHDCLNYITVTSARTGRPCINPRTYGTELHAEEGGDLILDYNCNLIAAQQEIPDNAPDFLQGVIYLLAARVSNSLNGSLSQAQMLEEQAERHLMNAITRDAQQQGGNKTHPLILRRNSNIGR